MFDESDMETLEMIEDERKRCRKDLKTLLNQREIRDDELDDVFLSDASI